MAWIFGDIPSSIFPATFESGLHYKVLQTVATQPQRVGSWLARRRSWKHLATGTAVTHREIKTHVNSYAGAMLSPGLLQVVIKHL